MSLFLLERHSEITDYFTHTTPSRFALQFVSDFKPSANMGEVLFTSGKMSVRDVWMMSKLNKANRGINDMLEKYEFGVAQQAGYALWINDICDVYLELVKPVVYDTEEANKDKRWAAQACLWNALETGLRLLHPMMPYVTEELWQRLPGRGTLGAEEKQSIMLAKYPEGNSKYENLEVEGAMEGVLEVVKAFRSLKTQYNIKNADKPKCFIKCTDAKEFAGIEKQCDDIETLGKVSAKMVEKGVVVSESCSVVIVSSSISVYMDLEGVVDYSKEVQKLTKESKKVAFSLLESEKKISADGYAERVPKDVQKKNQEEKQAAENKLAELKAAIAKFEKLAAAKK